MKKFLLFGLSFLLGMAFISDANAQAVRNHLEKAQDHKQIHRDKETLARDKQELAHFRAMKNRLWTSIKNANKPGAHASHSALVQSMQREVHQSEQKIALDVNEVKQSGRELNSSRKELKKDVHQGKPMQAMDDRRDKKDDKRDLIDDRADLKEQRVRTARQKEILAEFRSIIVKGNPQAFKALKSKKNLLDEFEQTMVRDLGEEFEELKEDKRELKEDRRETNEDRKQK